jgi:hypothetical protein
MSAVRRRPAWSGVLTAPLAARIPDERRQLAITTIKAFHSAAFFSIAGLIVVFAWDGVHGRQSRRTAIAAVVALAESAVYASNNQVCPLTPLVEELGAESGSVTDIFLPEPISRRIPRYSGGLLVFALVLHGRARLANRTLV